MSALGEKDFIISCLGNTRSLISDVWPKALPGSFLELQLHCLACKGL